MPITASHAHVSNGSRYDYDFGLCSSRTGWAQFDTPLDASYFGMWVHPERRQVLTFCEGDLTTQTADTDAELVALLTELKQTYTRQDARPPAIDPGLDPQLKQRFRDIGAGALLYPDPDPAPSNPVCPHHPLQAHDRPQ